MDTHPKHLPADERRAVTVESVVALAGSQNPSEITTAAIAKHMNLTQGALFRHFPNKEAIWQAVMKLAAASSDGKAVTQSFAHVQESCLGCHQAFRKPFVEHFYGAR